MTEWTRRSLLRASAGVAVAVPMAALGTTTASAHTIQHTSDDGPSRPDEPVMFAIHDAAAGEVSILHGTTEVIVRDRRLVSRILTAAGAVRA